MHHAGWQSFEFKCDLKENKITTSKWHRIANSGNLVYIPHSENILLSWLGKPHGWDRLGDDWVYCLAGTEMEKGMVCDVAVCHLKPRERTHSQHTCEPCSSRKALIILARVSRAPGTRPGQYASLFACSDNHRLFLSVVIRGCCFHRTLSEPVCSSSPLFPPTFWNYPLIHSFFSFSTYIWRCIERLLHPHPPTPLFTKGYSSPIKCNWIIVLNSHRGKGGPEDYGQHKSAFWHGPCSAREYLLVRPGVERKTQQVFGLRNKKGGRGRRRMRVSLEKKNRAFNKPFLIVVTPKVQLKKLIVPLFVKNTLLLFSG